MPLDPQVLEIYKSKPAPPEKYVLEEMRAGADATFNDKTEGHRNIRIRGQDYSRIPAHKDILPRGQRPLPVLIYFHGGGFVMHNIASHDSLCRKLSTELNRIVVSVGYRLAPRNFRTRPVWRTEAPFKWVYENAPVFGGISEKIVLSGDSASATISVSVCLWNIKHGLPFRRVLCFSTECTEP